MIANRAAISAPVPSRLDRATIRKTGIRARRRKPIALGIVHGRSGCPASVCSGGGPERSSPSSRRGLGRARSRGGGCWEVEDMGVGRSHGEPATSVYAIEPGPAPSGLARGRRTRGPPRSGALAGPGQAPWYFALLL